jgi:hypothetical protein
MDEDSDEDGGMEQEDEDDGFGTPGV